MRLGKYLTQLTKSELEETKKELNLTDDELKVFEALSKGKSNVVIADMCGIATSTLSNRIKAITLKLDKTKEVKNLEFTSRE